MLSFRHNPVAPPRPLPTRSTPGHGLILIFLFAISLLLLMISSCKEGIVLRLLYTTFRLESTHFNSFRERSEECHVKRKSRMKNPALAEVSEHVVLYVMAKLDSHCVPGQEPSRGTIVRQPGLRCPTRGQPSRSDRVRACTDHQTHPGSSPISRHQAVLRQCSLLDARPRRGPAGCTNPGHPDSLLAASMDPVHCGLCP
jgi:hypothetical protein